MPERQPTGLPEQPLMVREGIAFTPFEDLISLPLPKESKTFVESVDYVASVKIALGRLTFNLALALPEDHFFPDFGRNESNTPLGEVDLIHRYLDGEETTLQTGLGIVSFSVIDSLKDYVALSNYELELKMGSKVYYLDCVEPMLLEEAAGIINKEIFEEEDGGGHFVSKKLRDSSGEDLSAILPYDVGRLSTIEGKIVKKS